MTDFARPGLERIDRAGNYRDPSDPGELNRGRQKRRSVTDDECLVLARLAAGKRVLEIGTGLGVSARALASTAEHVTTVDPDPWVADPGLPNVTFRRTLPDDLRAYDLAFIDGSHERDAVIADLLLCRHIPDLLLHDTNLPGVAEAIAATGVTIIESYGTPCHLARYTHS